ncbi:MAG TPA: hypothetical protein PKE63_08680 [Lacibacter sp.]|nr:hypothetical protein [Lacibacter sp.]HMO88008.1 hypothetical protein [Lacibacter sp.]HMP87338.1 hypothetical protein [Lacibacter sp.]
MKLKTAYFSLSLLLVVLVATSCSRSFTPYQAAHHPHGKRCLNIR